MTTEKEGWRFGVECLAGESGQDLLEYGLLMALIAVFALGAVTAVGTQIDTVFWQSIAASF